MQTEIRKDRKGAINRTELVKPLLVAKGFNTNLIQLLLPHHVIISTVGLMTKPIEF